MKRWLKARLMKPHEWIANKAWAFIEWFDPAPYQDRTEAQDALEQMKAWLLAESSEGKKLLDWIFLPPEHVVQLSLKKAAADGFYGLDPEHARSMARVNRIIAKHDERHRQQRLERDVLAVMEGLVSGHTIVTIAPTQEYATRVYNEAVRRIGGALGLIEPTEQAYTAVQDAGPLEERP